MHDIARAECVDDRSGIQSFNGDDRVLGIGDDINLGGAVGLRGESRPECGGLGTQVWCGHVW